jgi:transcriptional regulator with XRE-family HTH domain
MTPAAFKEARHTLGLTLSQAAHVLGYDGAHGAQQVRRMESGERAIRGAQARLMLAYLAGYRPEDWPVSK